MTSEINIELNKFYKLACSTRKFHRKIEETKGTIDFLDDFVMQIELADRFNIDLEEFSNKTNGKSIKIAAEILLNLLEAASNG